MRKKFPTEYHHKFDLITWGDLRNLNPMRDWCNKNVIGVWRHYDMIHFEFSEKTDLVMFILKWS